MSVFIAVGRTFLAIVFVIAVYAFIPVNPERSQRMIIALLVVGMVVWLGAVARQVGRLRRSDHPLMIVGEALTMSVSLIVVIFALVYLMIGTYQPDAFSQHLDKSSALYFSMTVTSTVGFGDIVPVIPLSRHVVTFQMLVNLVFLAVVIHAITVAATESQSRAKSRREEEAATQANKQVAQAEQTELNAAEAELSVAQAESEIGKAEDN